MQSQSALAAAIEPAGTRFCQLLGPTAPVYIAHLKAPYYAAMSVFENLLGYDPTQAAQACRVPMAYLAAGVPLIEQASDLGRSKTLCPQLAVAKTLGAEHFSPLEVPDQINAMIERFLTIGIWRNARTGDLAA